MYLDQGRNSPWGLLWLGKLDGETLDPCAPRPDLYGMKIYFYLLKMYTLFYY